MMKSRVLIIDDNEMMRSFLQHILGNTFDVAIASSGEEALHLLQDKSKSTDLILADFDLEGMSGLDLTAYLKSSLFYRQIPVVILSGKGNSSNRISCLKAGATDFITKPFNPIELQVKLSRIIESLKVLQIS